MAGLESLWVWYSIYVIVGERMELVRCGWVYNPGAVFSLWLEGSFVGVRAYRGYLPEVPVSLLRCERDLWGSVV